MCATRPLHPTIHSRSSRGTCAVTGAQLDVRLQARLRDVDKGALGSGGNHAHDVVGVAQRRLRQLARVVARLVQHLRARAARRGSALCRAAVRGKHPTTAPLHAHERRITCTNKPLPVGGDLAASPQASLRASARPPRDLSSIRRPRLVAERLIGLWPHGTGGLRPCDALRPGSAGPG